MIMIQKAGLVNLPDSISTMTKWYVTLHILILVLAVGMSFSSESWDLKQGQYMERGLLQLVSTLSMRVNIIPYKILRCQLKT